MINSRNVIGIIPAAGYAHRIAPLSCSKEVYPIVLPDGSYRVVSSYLLKRFAQASANKSYFIIRHGKWDIPEYFKDGSEIGKNVAFIVTDETRGVPFTIDKAYSFIKDAIVLFGFPDIIFKPVDAFSSLLKKQQSSGADLVLGLFNATNPGKMDMVEFNDKGEITNIIIKPVQTGLTQTWIIAVWSPVFSQFLHKNVLERKSQRKSCEVHLGEVFRKAIQAGIKTDYVLFEQGRYLDIGTPDDLEKAKNIDWLE